MAYDQIPQRHVCHKYNSQISPFRRQLPGAPSQSKRNCIRSLLVILMHTLLGVPLEVGKLQGPIQMHHTAKLTLYVHQKNLNTGVFDSTVFTSLNAFPWTSSSHLKCVSALRRLLKDAVIPESGGTNR